MTPALARLLVLIVNLALASSVMYAEFYVFFTDPKTRPGELVVPIVDGKKIAVREDAKLKGIDDYRVISDVLGWKPPPPKNPTPVAAKPAEPVIPPIERVLSIIAVTYTERFSSCYVKSRAGGQQQLSPGDEVSGYKLVGILPKSAEPEEYRIVFSDQGGKKHEITFRP